MIKADLHTHSKYSNDGEFGISEITDRCISQGVNVFSVTDHNSVKGINEAIQITQQTDIEFIPGIEIDCCYKDIDLHVLGYCIHWESNDFSNLEKTVYTKVMASLSEMIHNLTQLGFIIDIDAVLSKANGILPSAEMIAEVMLSDEKYYSPLLLPYMKGGERSDMPYINFYLDYFAQGKSAYVPVNHICFSEAIEIIRDNGGIPIIAHPGLNLKGKEEISEQLLDKGAEGLEVFNNYHDMNQIDYFATEVGKRNNIMTCGSDFHGKTKPLISIGQFKFKEQYSDYLHNSVKKLMN